MMSLGNVCMQVGLNYILTTIHYSYPVFLMILPLRHKVFVLFCHKLFIADTNVPGFHSTQVNWVYVSLRLNENELRNKLSLVRDLEDLQPLIWWICSRLSGGSAATYLFQIKIRLTQPSVVELGFGWAWQYSK